jgi:hypothetical protein
MASKVAEAYARSKSGREALFEVGRSMECTEDKCGIVWERFILPNGISLILVATPHWWDVYAPIDDTGTTASTVDALRAIAAREVRS